MLFSVLHLVAGTAAAVVAWVFVVCMSIDLPLAVGSCAPPLLAFLEVFFYVT